MPAKGVTFAGKDFGISEIRRCGRRQERLPSHSVPVPVVELPLGATEDRVCGTMDIERALASGRKVFDPGLLARANRGFLYIDEVNRLENPRHGTRATLKVAELPLMIR
jgi:magnesium chelatase subunit I